MKITETICLRRNLVIVKNFSPHNIPEVLKNIIMSMIKYLLHPKRSASEPYIYAHFRQTKCACGGGVIKFELWLACKFGL